MYTRVTYILVVVLAVLLLSSCQEKRKDRFVREAQEFTETYCPQSGSDGITILDSLVFVPNDSTIGDLKLYYSLVLTSEQREQFMNKLGQMGDMNLKVIRNSVQFAKHRDAGATFTYIYHDAEIGDEIVRYHFTAKDYE